MKNGNGKAVLVLGATGGIGGEVARTLATRGWEVHAMRRGGPPDAAGTITWHEGDAMNAGDVLRAARGVEVIVHGVNPPRYQRWAELVLPMMENTLAAARVVGARIVLPGTIYNFGPDAFPLLREDAPQRPVTRKGAIRVEMERRLRESGVPAIVVRAGDYFGPRQQGNGWFGQVVVNAGKPVTTITLPNHEGIGHQWAYLPDVAETMVRLLERDADLEAFAVFHMEGHWDADGTQMIDAIRRIVGNPSIKVARMPWRLMRLLSPFVPLFRELAEMRYLWNMPVRMDNRRLTSLLGAEPHTPLDTAVQTTLLGLGCLS